jgi:hypothetical protein
MAIRGLYSRLNWAILVTLTSAAPALAVFNGNPVPANGGSASDSNANGVWTSTLDPNPAISQATCPWITNGLNAQGFTAANGWTINYLPLTGGLSITKYTAWVTQQPTETINATNYGGNGPFSFYGGADIGLHYTPQGTDPTTIHWLQAIYTNQLLNNTIPNYNFVLGGVTYYEYLDNAGTYNTNPYYDNGGLAPAPDPANNTDFLDIPARAQNPFGTTVWQAQAFVSTWDPGNKIINIYQNGVWWGFDLNAVPEPASLGLLGLGTLTLLQRRRARTAA